MSPSAETLTPPGANSSLHKAARYKKRTDGAFVFGPYSVDSAPRPQVEQVEHVERVQPPVERVLDIVDIRRAKVEMSLRDDILSMFRPKKGPRAMPTLLLYDEQGLQLFEKITYLDEYYLTNHEIDILRSEADSIARHIPHGSMIMELGSGNLRKVNLLLRALEAAGKKIDYYALDLSRCELERTLAQLPEYEHVRCHGLLGTYDDGREWLKSEAVQSRQKCILTLGSSIGNFERDEAAKFLHGFSDVLLPGDSFLIGLDSCNNPSKVYHAYNDREGVTHKFILNGLAHANRVLGEEAFVLSEWRVIGEYVYSDDGGTHRAFYAPLRETVVLGERVYPHDRILIEISMKYSPQEVLSLWQHGGMEPSKQWMHADKEYGLHLLTKPKMPFSLLPSSYAKTVTPSLQDWEATWEAWDTVTRRMLPNEELLEKPIKLRNACIFYLGHIPTFLDIQLNKTTKGKPTEPASYAEIFERGIDPDVDNPELCHAHSRIPDEWPALNDIIVYQQRVRERVRAFYPRNKANNGSSEPAIPRAVAQAIWVGFEHELMHLETLLYMMLQSDKTLPPPNMPRPDFAKLAARAQAARVPNQWFDVPAQDIVVGLNDPDGGTDATLHFGWDNEKPRRKVHVPNFQAQGRPITNEEYGLYLYSRNVTKLPASWSETPLKKDSVASKTNGYANGHLNGCHQEHANGCANGHANGKIQGAWTGSKALPRSFLQGKFVRTVYGPVALEYALDWPVFASYDELSACAAWMGGRIPTFEEARSIYAHVDGLKKKAEAEKKLGQTLPAVNGHLSNNGVQETPPSDSLFMDLDGANVGLQHWHPMPVTAHGNRLCGQSEMGGVWEWTSSVLQPHEGFEPMALYPGYTADFFDGKHNIVLGGSWATHPRIAGRKSFVNWYQRNYLYAWVGARLVRDLE